MRETRFDLNEDPMRCSASQRAVWPYMAIPPLEAGQAEFSLRSITVGVQVDFSRLCREAFGYVLDCAPQTFHQDVVLATLSF